MDGLTVLLRRSRSSVSCDLPRPLVPVHTDPIIGAEDFYNVNVVISGILAIISTLLILVLIWRHATNMSRPREQLYIIRICLLLPIFAVSLWVGIYIPWVYVYVYSIIVICEPVTLVCFFLFICETLVVPASSRKSSLDPSSPSSRQSIFFAPLVTRAQQLNVSPTDKRVFAAFRRRWFAIAQNIPVAWAVAVVSIATEAVGDYCLTARDAYHAHIYVTVFRTVSTFLALFAVLRMTLPVRAELKKHRAMSKLWAFKVLIFLQTSQDFIFSIIDSKAPRSVIESSKISRVDFITGIPSLVVEIELVIFALFFHYAYNVSMYQLSAEQKAAGARYVGYGWRLIYKVFDIRDVPALILFAFGMSKQAKAYEMTLSQKSPLSEATHALLDRSTDRGTPELDDTTTALMLDSNTRTLELDSIARTPELEITPGTLRLNSIPGIPELDGNPGVPEHGEEK